MSKVITTICDQEVRVEGRLLRMACLEADKYLFLDDPKPVLEGLKQSGLRADIFTFMQKLPETKPRYGYPMEWDNLAALPVSSFDHWWTEQIGFKARNKAKQAHKKGVVLREVAFDETLAKGIWEVYNESPMRQREPNAHYGKSVETVYREEATFLDHSIFIGAYLDKKLIGFVKLVVDRSGTQAGLLNIVSMIRHRDKAPTNALVAEAVRACAQRNIPYLVYSSFAYGKKQTSTLADFKERNGFTRVDLPRYYVPLTAWGRVALRSGLHRRLVDYIPESVASRLRDLRSAWYARKVESATEAS